MANISGVESRGAGGALAPPGFGASLKGQSLISACRSLAITASTSGFEKLSMALNIIFGSYLGVVCFRPENQSWKSTFIG